MFFPGMVAPDDPPLVVPGMTGVVLDLRGRLVEFYAVPPLYDAENFRGEQNNIFPGVVSINMLCIPKERNTVVQGLREIDPTNWTCPVQMTR